MSKCTMYLTRSAENRYWKISEKDGDYYHVSIRHPGSDAVSVRRMKVSDYEHVDCYPVNIPCSRQSVEE